MTVKTKIYQNRPEDAFYIRKKVFMDEQGFHDEFDEIDDRAAHIVIYTEDEKPMGTCRIFQDEEGQYILGRLAILKEYRGLHLGEYIMKEALRYVAKVGGDSLALHAQVRAKEFYQKQGFTEYGEIEDDEGCPHIWMKKYLMKKNLMKKQIFNPYLPSYEYIPDGEPHIFGERLYIFGSHDKFGGTTYCENDYVCYSAPVDDLSAWRYEGVIYRKDQHPYQVERPELFAPDVVQGRDGRYYLYYSMAHSSLISVAVCDEPAGKYEYLCDVHLKDGQVLGNRPGDFYQFDPAVLVDDDGKVYLYSGFCPTKKRVDDAGMLYAGCHVTELAADMVTVVSEPKLVIERDEEPETGARYLEAPSIRKINGLYYLVYSARCTGLYYYVSQYPDHGFAYGGRIHSTSDVGINGYTEDHPAYPVGNTHGGIVGVHGKYYIFDHRLTNNSSFSRQGVAEEIKIEENGHIAQVESTSCGLNNGPLIGEGTYPAYIACNLIDANLYQTKEEKITRAMCITQDGEDVDAGEFWNHEEEQDSGQVQYIKNIHDKCTIGFKYFDFDGVNEIVLIVRGHAKGDIQIKLEHSEQVCSNRDILKNMKQKENNSLAQENKLESMKQIARLKKSDIQSDQWIELSIPVNIVTGVYAIYISFTGEGTFEMKEINIRNVGMTTESDMCTCYHM